MKPRALDYFYRCNEYCLLALEGRKESGTQVAGIYCVFAPVELVRAAGILPVGLCGKKQAPIPAAEKVLPANLCPLIKSSYGYGITDTCPFFAASDFLIGETTCDGKKKMYELLGRIKPLFLMHLPYTDDEDRGLPFWLEETMRLKDFLEARSGNPVQKEEVVRQIVIHNKVRALFNRLVQLNAGGRSALSAVDMMIVMESKGFVVDLDEYASRLQELVEELETMLASGYSATPDGAPRILLTGCPVGKGSEKTLRLIEECGGNVVCQENCTGTKSFHALVDEQTDDPYEAIARRYLSTPCSCMTPNEGRHRLLGRLVEELGIQGIIDLTWQCCHTYNIESYGVEEFVRDRYGVPLLHVETDYTDSDTEQLRTRIEAFLEMVAAGL